MTSARIMPKHHYRITTQVACTSKSPGNLFGQLGMAVVIALRIVHADLDQHLRGHLVLRIFCDRLNAETMRRR